MLFSLNKIAYGKFFAVVAIAGLALGASPSANAANPQATASNNVPLADLVVIKFVVTGKQTVQNGKLVIPIQIVVRNQGKVPAAGKFAVGVKQIGQWKWVSLTDTLGPGQSRAFNSQVKVRNRPNGRTIRLTAMADAPVAAGDTSIPKTGRVPELNEANNTRKISFKVSK